MGGKHKIGFGFTLMIVLAFGIYSCGNDSANKKEKNQKDTTENVTTDPAQLAMEQRIDSLNTKMMEVFQSTGKPDIRTSMYAVQAYEDYAFEYKEAPKSGYFLMKAGEIYENILNDKDRAIRRYQSAYLHPSDFDNKPMTLFRSANLYAEKNDTTKAIYSFKLFIEKYPKHDFADDAENMIRITRIGMDKFLEEASKNADQKEAQ